MGGVGEHGILGSEPATGDFLVAHPAGDAVFDGGGADDAGVSEADEDGAGGVWCDVWVKGNGAELVIGSGVGACHGREAKPSISNFKLQRGDS